jgi:hypothetical protein
MTTGRINQVTIVRRGWPTVPCGTEELVPDCYTTVKWWDDAAVQGRAYRATIAIRFSPLNSPEPGPPHKPLRIAETGEIYRPQEETCAR